MRALTEDDVRKSFINTDEQERALIGIPADLVLVDWDYRDFFAWRDPARSRHGYIIIEIEGNPVGVVMRASDPGRSRAGMCNICRTLQPGSQVSLFSARRSGEAGQRGDSVGTYICSDLSCHDNVRIAHPLAPNEVRAPGQIDQRLDGTRQRMTDFVHRVLAPEPVA